MIINLWVIVDVIFIRVWCLCELGDDDVVRVVFSVMIIGDVFRINIIVE